MQISHAGLAIWRYAGLAPGWRVGLARLRVRKGENGASLQVEIWGLSPISNSVNLSHLVFCENIACEPHYCSCIRALNPVMAGPIVAFSANSGSIICNEAPLRHFLPTSFAECFR